jgi:hypothetical protein
MSFKLIIPPWVALGFYRGIRSYEYDHKNECIQYEKNKEYNKKPQYLYSSCMGVGLLGSFLYVNPFLAPLIIPTELYRLEVNLRGLDEEKEKRKYNNIF